MSVSIDSKSTTNIVYDIDRCLFLLKRCVRLSPDGTVKPEAMSKQTPEEFSSWVRSELNRKEST